LYFFNFWLENIIRATGKDGNFVSKNLMVCFYPLGTTAKFTTFLLSYLTLFYIFTFHYISDKFPFGLSKDYYTNFNIQFTDD